VDGTELGKFFEGGELFDIQDATRLMTQLLDALELAHNAGIVHRDIKPANVMVDSEGQAKLADFGVARVSDGQDATQVGSMVGTPAYMSPEQVQGQPVDRRTDIFSAGVILYQFLTGQKPFQGGGAYTLARKIIHDDPVMPSALVASISPAYDRVIRRALAKSVDERYQTAREFSQALNALMTRSAPDAPDDDSTRKISSADMPKAAPVAAAAPLQPESLASGVELEFWRAIKDSEEVDDFELYLTKFPSGVYAELAQRKVAKLKRATTAAAEEAATLRRQLEEEAQARRAAEEKAKLEVQAQAQAQRAAQLKREAEAEAAARRAAEAAAAAAVQKAATAQVAKPAVAPAIRPSVVPAAQASSQAEPAKKSSKAIPAVIGVLVLAGAAGAYFAMQPKTPVEASAPAAPVQAPAQVAAPAKPEPKQEVAQPVAPTQRAPVADEKKQAEKATRELVKAAPAPAQVVKPGTDAVGKAAASKAAADAAAAKASADMSAAKSAAEQAAAQSAAAAAAAEQRAAAAEQRAAAAEKAAADRATADKAAAEKAASEKVAAEKAAAAAKAAAPSVDAEALAARRVARAKELEWTKGGPTGSKPRSKAEIEAILKQEGLVPGGTPVTVPVPLAAPAAGNAGAVRPDCNNFGSRTRNMNC
jgi:serine/threonine-protein kinase